MKQINDEGLAMGIETKWVGITDEKSEGTFYYESTHQTFHFADKSAPWPSNEPNGGTRENCVAMDKNRKIYDVTCNDGRKMPSICEYQTRLQYIVVQRHPEIVKGPFSDLQLAKDELEKISKNGKSRMMLEIIDGVLQVDPISKVAYISGIAQTPANGFYQMWWSWADIKEMVKIVKQHLTNRNDGATDITEDQNMNDEDFVKDRSNEAPEAIEDQNMIKEDMVNEILKL
jgi:hypothetical protein